MMVNAQTITHWMQPLAKLLGREPQVMAEAEQVTAKLAEFQTMMLETTSVPTAMIQARGVLDRYALHEFIMIAKTLYQAGARQMVIDLNQVTALELSGLFALHSIAHLYAGEGLLDPEHGWAILHHLANKTLTEAYRSIKLVSAAPVTVAAIGRTSFSHCFERYTTLEAALAALELAPTEKSR
jgi:hypothetical protein